MPMVTYGTHLFNLVVSASGDTYTSPTEPRGAFWHSLQWGSY